MKVSKKELIEALEKIDEYCAGCSCKKCKFAFPRCEFVTMARKQLKHLKTKKDGGVKP